MGKIIILTESQVKKLIESTVSNESVNYMFFSNLEQIKRQCDMILKMDPQKIDEIIQNGHDWADDHISEAKTNIDQVFDFFKNEISKEYVDYEMMNENSQLDEKCWEGYKRDGSKKKNGKMVPNCVPTNEASSSVQQAAIAINMKKKGIKPKNESYGEIDESKNKPTNPKLWASSLAWAKTKYKVCPSAYCNGAAAKHYKSKGGGWKTVKK
jgi:hypothetical protein